MIDFFISNYLLIVYLHIFAKYTRYRFFVYLLRCYTDDIAYPISDI